MHLFSLSAVIHSGRVCVLLETNLPLTQHFKEKLMRLPVGGMCGQGFSPYKPLCPSLL